MKQYIIRIIMDRPLEYLNFIQNSRLMVKTNVHVQQNTIIIIFHMTTILTTLIVSSNTCLLMLVMENLEIHLGVQSKS